MTCKLLNQCVVTSIVSQFHAHSTYLCDVAYLYSLPRPPFSTVAIRNFRLGPLVSLRVGGSVFVAILFALNHLRNTLAGVVFRPYPYRAVNILQLG